jgi:DUF4097 and DUF4098 domain-containing protein YvlB
VTEYRTEATTLSEPKGPSAWKRRRKPILIGLGLALGAFLGLQTTFLAIDHASTKKTDDAFIVGAAPRLVVDNSSNGRIEVRAGNYDTVRVQSDQTGAWRQSFKVKQSGDTITVSANTRGALGWLDWGQKATIIVTVPAHTSVDLATDNGGIDAYGITGDTKLRTDNGRIALHDVTGAVDAATDNGSIDFTGELHAGDRAKLSTDNGRVKVKLLGAPSVALDAATDNGTVKSRLPVLTTSSGNHKLVGTIGAGEAALTIRTDNGSVTIE